MTSMTRVVAFAALALLASGGALADQTQTQQALPEGASTETEKTLDGRQSQAERAMMEGAQQRMQGVIPRAQSHTGAQAERAMIQGVQSIGNRPEGVVPSSAAVAPVEEARLGKLGRVVTRTEGAFGFDSVSGDLDSKFTVTKYGGSVEVPVENLAKIEFITDEKRVRLHYRNGTSEEAGTECQDMNSFWFQTPIGNKIHYSGCDRVWETVHQIEFYF